MSDTSDLPAEVDDDQPEVDERFRPRDPNEPLEPIETGEPIYPVDPNIVKEGDDEAVDDDV